MHLWMMLIRWLWGVIARGLRAADRWLPEAPVRTLYGPDRQGHQAPGVPSVGWMMLRRLLWECNRLPGRHQAAVHVVCAPRARRLRRPVRADRVLGRMAAAPPSCTGPADPAHPSWG